jgi:acyl-CoA reductase-like NAD-dependent aldehyde dehydrogenase
MSEHIQAVSDAKGTAFAGGPLVDAERRGSAVFSRAEGEEVKATSREDIDAALEVLEAHKQEWADLALQERIALLDVMLRDLPAIADRWIEASAEAKGLDPQSVRAGEEAGAFSVVVRLIRLFRKSLHEIDREGRPAIPGSVRQRGEGDEAQLVVPVFPIGVYDKLLFWGLSGEVRLRPGVTRGQLEEEQAAFYRQDERRGKLALVLAAGNYSNLGPADMLHKLFAEGQVVIMKMNPVNAYLGPLIEEAFRALVDRGFLRVVYGGAAEGDYLAHHESIEELHLTGSDKTYEAIVFGPGDEGRKRKAEQAPQLDKRFTCELGSLSPLIVVPGPWSDKDIAYQAQHIASTLTLNAGFNCLSTRVIVQHRGWERREALLDGIRRVFQETPTRTAYYPGAEQIHEAFVRAHPEAEQLGEPQPGTLPWTLIADVDPEHEDDICFTTEAFCSLFAETALEAPSVAEYVDRAVAFVNEKLWGTLTATLLVHPKSLRDAAVAKAVDRAVADLRYGTVAVNQWGIMGFLMGTTTWGGFPGHESHDIQSGSGVVNNALMLPQVEKTVLYGPFRQFPKPPIFVTHKTTDKLFRRLIDFEARPTAGKLIGLFAAALRG